MFIVGLFSWWYGAGWKGVLGATQRRLFGLADMFSIDILIRMLFAPWKRVVTYPGASFDAKLRALGDNLVSRAIGFIIRFFVLCAAALSCIALLIAGLAELILWPLAPVAGIALIVWGLL